MSDKIRCPACRGAKKVPKLGGMIGECNTCSGEGSIKSSDKPVPVKVESLPMTDAIIKATSEALPVSIAPVVEAKIDPKKAVFKRKTASK